MLVKWSCTILAFFLRLSHGIMLSMANRRDCTTKSPILPAFGFVRMRELIGPRKADGQRFGILPVSRSCIELWVRQGKMRPPFHLSPKVAVWSISYIRELCERLEREGTL